MLQQFYPVAPHNFKFELNKDMQFAAAHYIDHPTAGKCQNVHGHTYFANVTIVGNELMDNGFLINFQELKKAVHGKYDHTMMNEHDEFKFEQIEPSTENVAKAIYQALKQELSKYDNDPQVLQVIVRETPTSYVTYKEGL
ncbi:6-carboxytetrahydropterin synthase QueD [Mammaliicoccus sciuri]|uniref:6-carboxytetrahydropterin synthase QueD n=1 Tax=Mammaliicoccus sciuri TaxID=1296 RepID=UPI001D0D3E1F|nr:6-carboxytetrahydropterin synthase QueD [Mammaliicoccus sciuri]MCC2087902.1 6-carboxytetrahydropterin synthase QueD [Mammaliicoccus sciuri]